MTEANACPDVCSAASAFRVVLKGAAVGAEAAVGTFDFASRTNEHGDRV
jgi:hypothetical protein